MTTSPYTIPDPEYPFLKKLNEPKQYRYALSFWEDPPLKFLRWLEGKGVDPATVSPRTEPRGEIDRRICRDGKRWQARAWRTQAREEILKLDLKTLGRGGANELVWWFVEEVVQDFDPDPENPKFQDADLAGMEFLPDYMRWVALHPALAFFKDNETEQIRFQTKQYETLYPCPNQASRTMLATIRGKDKLIDGFFKDCLRKHFEDMKAGKPDESEVVVAERKRIKKLEDVFGLKKPA